jgi:hypothetical protein
MDKQELPYHLWIPKLHKNLYLQRYIAGSSKCSTKPLSQHINSCEGDILNVLHHYICQKWYINQMWILKNSKDLLANIEAQNFS